MVEFMMKSDILALKRQGFSDRKVAKMLKCNRKTVAKYWGEYKTLNKQLEQEKDRSRKLEIQQNMISIPQYDSSTRTRRTITPEIIETIGNILKDEKKKERLIGNNKQNLTVKQIHELLEEQGTYISLSSTYKIVQELKHKAAQCFIMQDYEYADRLEYDFGEFTVFINDIKAHYYLAVMTSPASNYRWAYIYKTCGKDVFLESQIRFFHQIGGVWKEIVYDNMRNVVTKFIGRTEKLLNEDLIKLSTYYGFKINVTNCYSGNEKGSVENSVKYIRKQCFAKKYKFDTEDELFKYFNEQLKELNKNSKINEERLELLQLPPKYEVATITTATVFQNI